MNPLLARGAAIALFLALAAGCALHPPQPQASWSAEELAVVDRFTVRGKVGFRRGDQGGSAALVWTQQGPRYDLAVTGPLGQGSATIRGNDTRIEIETGDGRRTGDSPEQLLAEAIGWPVSVNHLSYWARGLAAPGSAAIVTPDAAGHPRRIEQDGWVIDLDRYEAEGRLLMPHRIIATAGDSRVTLLVQRWLFSPAAPAGAPARPRSAE